MYIIFLFCSYVLFYQDGFSSRFVASAAAPGGHHLLHLSRLAASAPALFLPSLPRSPQRGVRAQNWFHGPCVPCRADLGPGPAEDSLLPAQAHLDWAKVVENMHSQSGSWSSSEGPSHGDDSVSTASDRHSSRREPVDLLPVIIGCFSVRQG